MPPLSFERGDFMGEAFLHGHSNGLRYKGLSASLPAPYNVFYNGQAIDISHAVVAANLGKTTVQVPPGSCSFTPQTATTSTTAITVSFTIGGIAKTASIPITVLATSSFANTPWEIVAQAAYYGFPKHIWQPGDTKTLTIGGTPHTIRIIGFDCDPLDVDDALYNDPNYNGGTRKASLALQWYTPAGILASASDAGTASQYWRNSTFRTTILPALLASLPDAIKNRVRTVDKLTTTLVSINGERIKKSLQYPSYDSETIFLPSYFDTCYMNPDIDLSMGSFDYLLRFDKPYTLFAHEWGDESDHGGYVFGDHSTISARSGEMVRNTYPPNSYNSIIFWGMLTESEMEAITPANPRYSKYVHGAVAYFPIFNL